MQPVFCCVLVRFARMRTANAIFVTQYCCLYHYWVELNAFTSRITRIALAQCDSCIVGSK
jgi:hypothetical protein